MKNALRIALSESHSGTTDESALASGRAMAIATHVYGVLVWFYPPAFRRDFALEMVCDFDEATSEAWREGRWLAVAELWLHVCHDLARTVLIQWLRHGLPLVPVLSAFGTTMFVFALASGIWRPLRPLARLAKDNDLTLLVLLATMVILIAAAVITFTVCFWLLVVRRDERVRHV
jgi:hypothetical protein